MTTTFNMKSGTRFGCWNGRIMSEASRFSQKIKEMLVYKIEILGLSETRWNGFGQEGLNIRINKRVKYNLFKLSNQTTKDTFTKVLQQKIKTLHTEHPPILSWEKITATLHETSNSILGKHNLD